jgi:hypothetical protein
MRKRYMMTCVRIAIVATYFGGAVEEDAHERNSSAQLVTCQKHDTNSQAGALALKPTPI